MAYLLDSNIVIPYLASDSLTVTLVEGLVPQGITISVISYLEAFQGTLRSPDPAAAQTRFDHFLTRVPVLPLSIPSPADVLSCGKRCACKESAYERGPLTW